MFCNKSVDYIELNSVNNYFHLTREKKNSISRGNNKIKQNQ